MKLEDFADAQLKINAGLIQSIDTLKNMVIEQQDIILTLVKRTNDCNNAILEIIRLLGGKNADN